MKFYIILSAFILFITSCSKQGENTEVASYENATTEAMAIDIPEPNSPEKIENSTNQQQERMLIKTGDIRIETDNIKESSTFLKNLLTQYRGYINSEERTTNYNDLESSFSFRIPSQNFDAFVNNIDNHFEKVENKTITTSDVTDEFIDLKARLKTKKQVEERYIALLSKAKNIKEILEIEREIGDLRGEIESAEGRMKYLQNQVSFSTLNITLVKYTTENTKPQNRFIKAFLNGWEGFVSFMIGLVYLWPFLLIIPFIYFFIKWLRRKKIKK
ncbi:DUF4349 domain-containing protein [Weeksellaceae bacterium TAE3-ERU29]|nr:DUF4349 domain-containing protein [Weeksellaceae bacterium TAE3-ERU29]